MTGSGRKAPATLYLLHFSEPYKHARHYTGITTDLPARLAAHEAGHGARLLQVAKAAGITWPGDRSRERQLKAQGRASRRCPQCGITPRTPPAQRQENTTMKKPPDRTAQDAGRRRPDYVIELAVSPELRDRTQHAWLTRPQTRGSARSKAAEPDPDRRQADREAEP